MIFESAEIAPKSHESHESILQDSCLSVASLSNYIYRKTWPGSGAVVPPNLEELNILSYKRWESPPDLGDDSGTFQ